MPNNADANEWHNLCLEDIGQFWDLPNWDDNKYFYFEAVDLKYVEPATVDYKSPVKAASVDDIIEDHYDWKYSEFTH